MHSLKILFHTKLGTTYMTSGVNPTINLKMHVVVGHQRAQTHIIYNRSRILHYGEPWGGGGGGVPYQMHVCNWRKKIIHVVVVEVA
jgi:hypothetical protein